MTWTNADHVILWWRYETDWNLYQPLWHHLLRNFWKSEFHAKIKMRISVEFWEIGNRILARNLFIPIENLLDLHTISLASNWRRKEIYISERFEVLKVHSKICPISLANKKSINISWSIFEKPKVSVLGFLRLGIFEKINRQCHKWTFRQSN